MPSPLSPRVERFISAYIDSVEKLEVLLHLRARPSSAWTPDEVARDLRIVASSAQMRLEDLSSVGLVSCAPGPPPRFRYEPAGGGHDPHTLAELAAAYPTYRVTVITRIFERPNVRIQGFSDAFRLRDDGD